MVAFQCKGGFGPVLLFFIVTVFILLLQIELSDERSSCKLTKKQNEKLKEELDRLHQEIIKYLF